MKIKLNRQNINKSKILFFVKYLVILAIVYFTVIQVLQQPKIELQAAGGGSIHLELNSSPQAVKVGEDLVAELTIVNPASKDISAADMVFAYDTNLLQFTKASLSAGWELVYSKSTDNYGTRVVIVNKESKEFLTRFLRPVKIHFKLKAKGFGNIGAENATITANGESQPLEIDKTLNKKASFTFDYPASATPTPNPYSSSISGKHLDDRYEQLVLPDQKITIESEDGRYAETTSASPTWTFNNLTPGLYTVTVAPIAEYKISHSVCYNCGSIEHIVESSKFSISISPKTNYSVYVIYTSLTPRISVTPTPNPFRSSVFPPEGYTGTFFAINAWTNTSQKIELIINGPGGNFKDVLDHGISDGRPGDVHYFYAFNSVGMINGIYSVAFAINGKQLGTDSFEILSLENIGDACVSITKNGDSANKIDLVVVSNKYEEKELEMFQQKILPSHINFLFSKDPFSFNKEKFNIWLLEYVNYLDCSHDSGWSCVYNIEKTTSQICTFADKIMVLDKEGGGGYVFVDSGAKTAVTGNSSAPESLGVTMHEFGHSMGKLADEYDAPNYASRTDRANCDIFACPKWCGGRSSSEEPECGQYDSETTCDQQSFNGVKCVWYHRWNVCDYPYHSEIEFGQACQEETVCYYGCGGRNGYRSSQYSIMGDTNFGEVQEYNAVSKKQIQKMIDSLVE